MRLLRIRARLRRTEKALARARLELNYIRPWSLDVFPGTPIPERVGSVIAAVTAEHLTYLTEAQLRSLAACVLHAEATGLPGILIEAGTARGGSAIVLAAAKAQGRELRVYDVFGMIPPPGERDGEEVAGRYADIAAGEARGVGGEVYYGYRDDLLGEVTRSFAQLGVAVGDHRVRLVQGLFQDTLVVDEPVALAHVDGDWYESTLTCLERIAPMLVPGGRIVIDDYYMWSGCRAAVHEYFDGRTGFRLEMRAKVHAVRVPDSGNPAGPGRTGHGATPG